MNRHSVRLLAAVFTVATLAGCFSDPAKSLRNGPETLTLNRSAAAIINGDSLLVEAVVRDEAGNPLVATGATWTTDNAAIATVNLAATQAPSDGTSRAYVAATNALGAITYVRVTVRGLTDSIRVTSLPRTLPVGLVTYTGSAKPDTLVTGPFTAPDTVLIHSGATLAFDASASVVRFGTVPAYILFRSDTLIKVMARGPFDGAATVTNITYPGNAQTGPILLDSLFTGDNVQVSRARLVGTATVTGDTLTVTATGPTTFNPATTRLWLGPTQALIIGTPTATTIRAIAQKLPLASYTGGVNVTSYNINGSTTLDSVYSTGGFTLARATFPGTITVSSGILMTVSAPAGSSFTTSGSNASVVLIGGSPTGIISRTASQIQVSSLVDTTGIVTVTSLVVGGVRVDTLRTTAPQTIAKATFTGTFARTGTKLLDTITVTAPAGVAFSTGATPSQVIVGGQPSFVLSRTATQMQIIPYIPGSLTSITNVDVGGTIFPSLVPANPPAAVTTTTGELGELANQARASATPLPAFTGAADTITYYGSIDCEDDGTACPGNGDWRDYLSFNLPSSAQLQVIINFMGDGTAGYPANGYCASAVGHLNPDVDITTRDNTGALIDGGSGATLTQPEISTTSPAVAAGLYYVRVDAWCTPAPMTYKLRIIRF